jgi:hypothetical protein
MYSSGFKEKMNKYSVWFDSIECIAKNFMIIFKALENQALPTA